MHWWGSGLIITLIYATEEKPDNNPNALLTENSFDILTESSQQILA
jgi:hypothetical protein